MSTETGSPPCSVLQVLAGCRCALHNAPVIQLALAGSCGSLGTATLHLLLLQCWLWLWIIFHLLGKRPQIWQISCVNHIYLTPDCSSQPLSTVVMHRAYYQTFQCDLFIKHSKCLIWNSSNFQMNCPLLGASVAFLFYPLNGLDGNSTNTGLCQMK